MPIAGELASGKNLPPWHSAKSQRQETVRTSYLSSYETLSHILQLTTIIMKKAVESQQIVGSPSNIIPFYPMKLDLCFSFFCADFCKDQ